MKLVIQSLGNLILLLLLQSNVAAQDFCFPKKNDNKLVYNDANLLTAEECEILEDSLKNLAASTGNQIVVVMVEDLCGRAPYEYATQLGESWKIGQAIQDNGIVFLIKPKRQRSKGEAFIAVGRGLEGALTDGFCGGLVRNEFVPYAKEGKYFEGIRSTIGVLSAIVKKEYAPEDYEKKTQKSDRWNMIISVCFVGLILFLVFYFKSRNVRKYAKANNIGFWAAWALINSMGHRHRGYYSNFRAGSGGFGGWGGGSGGGFGGFGGGSFGGGGGGGSW